MNENNDGIIASSTITTEWNQQGWNSEQNIPYSRFKKEIDKRKDLERKIAELESKFTSNASKQDVEDYQNLINLPADKFAQALEERAYNKALKAFQEIERTKQSELDKASQLLDEWFDFLRDSWIKINSQTEKEISQLALDYNINLEKPEDVEKVYNLYSTLNKTQGAGNSSKAETLWNNNKKNVTNTKVSTMWSWSDVTERIMAKHWLR